MSHRFVVEYVSNKTKGDKNTLPSLNSFEDASLALVKQAVRRTLASGDADEAVIYAPVQVINQEEGKAV